MFARATYLYFSIGENDFFYENLSSYLIHPSYFSMYLNVAIAWLAINVSLNNFEGKRFSNGIAVLIIVLFSGMILMLSSKLGIITMVLLYVGLIIYYIIHKRKYMIGIAGLGIIAISIFVVMNYVPAISDRINRALDAVTNANPNETEVESTAVRLLVWKAAIQVVSDNLIIGTGTGDAKDELMAEYKTRGMTGALAHELNAHNEFLQVFVSLGIIGFVLLLGNLYFPLFFAFKVL
jgi:O-antigen ligase